MTFVYFIMKKRRITQLFIALLVVVATSGYAWWQGQKPATFQVITLDIGQGDATLIKFRNGEKMLVDCGPNKKILERLGVNLSFYDRTIDYLLLSHPDLDHYGGCIEVLKRYTVKHILTNGHTKPDDIWHTFERNRDAEGARIRVIDRPEVITIASTTFEILSPDPELNLKTKSAKDSNNYSIVFRLIDQPSGQTMLFTADTEEPLEKALLAKYCSSTSATAPSQKKENSSCPTLSAQVLKVGHHGSDTSTTDEFLEAVDPDIAVISSGKNNRYGHPTKRVLNRLEKNGIEVLRTDQKGDILMP